jgi:acyl carrier protein
MFVHPNHVVRRLRWVLVAGALVASVSVATGTMPPQDSVEEEGVLQQVRDLVQLVLNAPVSADDTDIVESGLLDSLGLVELLVGIEREFDVQVDLETLDLDNLRSVRTIARTVVEAKRSATPGVVSSSETDAAS